MGITELRRFDAYPTHETVASNPPRSCSECVTRDATDCSSVERQRRMFCGNLRLVGLPCISMTKRKPAILSRSKAVSELNCPNIRTLCVVFPPGPIVFGTRFASRTSNRIWLASVADICHAACYVTQSDEPTQARRARYHWTSTSINLRRC